MPLGDDREGVLDEKTRVGVDVEAADAGHRVQSRVEKASFRYHCEDLVTLFDAFGCDVSKNTRQARHSCSNVVS